MKGAALAELLRFFVVWGLIGCFVFSVLVVVLFRTGLVYAARHRDGTLKEKVPWSGKLVMLTTLALFVGMIVAADVFGLRAMERTWTLGALFLVNYALYLIVFAFDSLAIDWLVLARWRPGFLRIPDEMDAESMRRHLMRSLPVGLVAGLLLAGLASAVSWYGWLRG